MLTGRKLLLADDSAAIQKVIELTFSDEGMEVTSVGDGGAALQKLEYWTPDVVLADAFMPGMNGYELCRSIKDNQRLSQIPVVLLISSFEPFDESDAKRAGADDVVTKPFQSIRELVNRVGSLIGGSAAEHEKPFSDYSTLGLERGEIATTMEPKSSDEPTVTVLVEASQMETLNETESREATCVPNVELQTADTQRLVPVGTQAPEQNVLHLQDTLEIEPISIAGDDEAPTETDNIEEVEGVSEDAPMRVLDESLLEIEEVLLQDAAVDDVVLDLDVEDFSITAQPAEQAYKPAVEWASQSVESASAQKTESGSREAFSTQPIAEQAPHVSREREHVETRATDSEAVFSPETLEIIARKVVERMSDKVVREIAWEIVPELSELLIKQKLDERK